MNTFKHFLKNISPITDSEFHRTISYFKEEKIRKGNFFVKQNNVCQKVGFILEGTLRTYYINEKAEEITSCFCIENNLTTSYKSFILQEPSALNLQAIEDTRLLVVNYDNLQKLYKESAVWQIVGRAIAEKEYIVMEQYASILNSESAKEKYLRLLKEQPNVLLKANIAYIASYLGVTRRTLSRIRKEVNQ